MTNQALEVQSAMREWQAVTDDLVAIANAFDPALLDAQVRQAIGRIANS